jgi:pimeloyl-ACP methyl ester carboxylesterase
MRQLASFSRLIMFDKRGTGLSDPVPATALPTLEQRLEDLEAVLEAVGSPRTAVMGASEGGAESMMFAATRPAREQQRPS